MARVLVTGATGFIGSALCQTLARQGHDVAGLASRDGDIADPALLHAAAPADHVFHLAGRTFVPDSWQDPAGFHRTNVLGTANVLEYCRQHGATLTFASTYLYGAPERLPVAETSALKPNNPYALSKHLAEQMCAFYAAHHGIDTTVIRPFNIFGPGQKPPFLVPHIVGQLKAGIAIRVKDLAPRRDYLYIDDLVDALVKSLGRRGGYNAVNIGSGKSFSVSELIATIQSVAGTSLPVISDGEIRPNEIDDVYADIGKAEAVLGWTPTLTFRQGIEQMMLQEFDS